MDPATIAVCVTTLVTPYLKKAAEEFAGEAGKDAANFVQEKAKTLWERLRVAFAGNALSAATLDRFAADPEAHKDELEEQLTSKLAQDQGLQTDLASAIVEVRKAAPQLRVVQKMQEAENVVGLRAKKMTRGSAEVTQEIGKGNAVTGIEIDEI